MAEKIIKNKIYEITIESLSGNGNSVGRIDGFVVFVPGGAAGDVLSVKIIKVTKSYAVGKIESIITPSPDRISGGCAKAGKCGGCSFCHISYEAECAIKRAMIDDSFERIGHLELKTSDFVPSDNIERYRNKVIYPVARNKDGALVSGFFAPMTHRIVEHEDCLIGYELFVKIREEILALWEKSSLSAYDEETESGLLRSIYMRKNSCGEMHVTLVLCGDGFGGESEFCKTLTDKFPEICGICINVNKKSGNSVLGDKWRTIHGEGYLTDLLCGKIFRIRPASFYQVNHAQTEKLYMLAKEFAGIRPGDTVFDLYCGTGTIGIILAEPDTHLVGVEICERAAKDAAENAERNGICGEFICLDAESALDSEKLLSKKPDVIIIDPPRKGCGTDAVAKIAAFDARTVVYISCNPQTLARDLEKFAECGYHAEKAVGVDLFPRTGHVECVVRLCRE